MENSKLSNQKETIAFLVQKYPNCFFVDGPVKPLKIGIFQDLAKDLEDDENISKRILRMALRHYTSSWRYLAAVKTGAARVDLAGTEGDLVEQQHAEHAAEQLKESKARAAKIREEKNKNKANNRSKPKRQANKSGDRTSGQKQPFGNKTSDKAKVAIKHKSRRDASNTSAKKVELNPEELVIGMTAKVQLGKEPMVVVIKKIEKDGILVQLKSGMAVKVQQSQLFKA